MKHLTEQKNIYTDEYKENHMSEKTILDYETVSLDTETDELVIIDQTLLPGKTEIIRLIVYKI